MNKNWLIRTKNNHILGPVSKNKVIDLIKNGSIKGGDEVSSGNGFWIYVREEDLVQKYVFSNTPQPFNPVQEAESVLTKKVDSSDAILPDEEDLEFPETSEEISDVTKIDLSLDILKQELSEEEIPEERDELSLDDLESNIELEDEENVISLSSVKASAPQKKRNNKSPKEKKESKSSKSTCS